MDRIVEADIILGGSIYAGEVDGVCLRNGVWWWKGISS